MKRKATVSAVPLYGAATPAEVLLRNERQRAVTRQRAHSVERAHAIERAYAVERAHALQRAHALRLDAAMTLLCFHYAIRWNPVPVFAASSFVLVDPRKCPRDAPCAQLR